MTPEDLMVGDWVQHASGKYFQVTRVDMWGDGSMHFACGHPHLWEYNNEFSPIPLTAEILDNNFKDITEPHQRIYGGRWVQYDEFFEVEITEYTDGIFQIVVDEIEMGGLPSWRMYVSNVHELQHALQLCGINKEIEL